MKKSTVQEKVSIFTRLKQTWYVPVIIVLLASISWIISTTVFGNESLRLDESQSIWQTSHSLEGTLKVVAQDVHMPLYHVILHYWIVMFGNDIELIRMLSFIFFLLCLPFIYLLARMATLSRKWSLFVVALFTLSPFVNWYANEARMYTLLAFMSIANQYFFARIMQGKKNSWPWYALTAVIGAYSHYFFFFNLITQAIFYFMNARKFPKKTFIKLVGVALLIIAAISPWIWYFISQGAASNTRPLLELPTAINFFNAYSQFLFGFQSNSLNTILISFWPLTVVVAFLLVRRFVKPNFPMHFIAYAAFVPPLTAFVLSFIVTPFFLSRYMVAAVAPLLIAIVWIMSRASKKTAIVSAIITFALTCALLVVQVVSTETPVRENYKQIAADITEKATPRDVVVMSTPFTVYPFEYYYNGTSQTRTLPAWDRQNPGPLPTFSKDKLPDEVNRLKKGHDYIYLILSYDQGYENDIRLYFRDNFEMVSKKTYSPSLELLVYRVGYKNPVSYK